MTYPATIEEVCAALRERGWPALARRLAYFASAADLEPGDVPLTAASALGFWSFFSRVASAGQLRTGCSQEGWLCVEWDFADQRDVCLWFKDARQVMFAARDANGRWVDIAGRRDTGNLDAVLAKLVEVGLFQWHQEIADGKNWRANTTSPDTAGIAT